MAAYYNEIDRFAAAWLRELIKAGHIAPGDVDERSIEDVQPDDLRGYTQCHFFAGIGVWSYALRLAGWPDDKQVWTGSCPCQPFSVSGRKRKFADNRHLWPVWFPLIRESRPSTVFGEQVASDDGLAWLDAVHADMEGQGYTIGTVDTPACGVGAPELRQRLYFVAESGSRTSQRNTGSILAAKAERSSERFLNGNMPLGHCDGGAIGVLADTGSGGWGARSLNERSVKTSLRGGATVRCVSRPETGGVRIAGELVNSERARHSGPSTRPTEQSSNGKERRLFDGASLTAGFWELAEWLYCRDEKYRPVEPGTFPLASGATNRVGRLRGYGNAINAEVAKEFIAAYLEVAGVPRESE